MIEITAGDDFDIIRTVTNIPSGQTVSSATLTIVRYEGDSSAVIEKEITSTLNSAGQITDTGADTTGSFYFILTSVDTSLLKPGNTYYYDIEIITNASKKYTAETGTINVKIPATQ